MRVLPLAFVAGLIIARIASPLDADAQSTPTPDRAFPETPPPEACSMPAREWDELKQLIGVSDEGHDRPPLPTAIPSGRPAGAETLVAINAAVHELGACHNAGDPRRELAFYTDRYLGAIGPFAPEAFAGDVRGPLPVEQRVRIESVSNVELLADGRVAAIVVIGNRVDADPAAGRTSVYVFANVGERWMVDDIVEEIEVGGEVQSIASIVGTPVAE